MPPPFFYSYEEFSHCTVAEFKDTLLKTSTKCVSRVTIFDLCSMSEYPNGLYFFYSTNPKVLQYVGKCTSRSFIERVPSHFDQRENAWFNTLPKKLAKQGIPYKQALSDALKFNVVLLGIRQKEVSERLESVFRNTYRPILNTPARPRPTAGDKTLVELVRDLTESSSGLPSAAAYA